jgi:hypothetical protein
MCLVDIILDGIEDMFIIVKNVTETGPKHISNH